MNKGELLYEGKAKKLFLVKSDADLVWVQFKDSFTAFNGEKKAEMSGKGEINAKISTLIYKYLKNRGVETHYVNSLSDTEMVCRKVRIIPLEVVVRNVLAGSTAKKFGIPEGKVLDNPLVEFYYKDDSLGDPFLSDDQALMLGAADSQETLEELKKQALKINLLLLEFFAAMKVKLIDFKLEFGKTTSGQVLLADEITPDTCRLWDLETNEKMDKDRFRRDLGGVMDKYREILHRAEETWEKSL